MDIISERPLGRIEVVGAVSKTAKLLPTLLRTYAGLEIVGANPLMASLAAQSSLDPSRAAFEGIILAGRRIELAAFNRRDFDQSAEKIASFKRLARDHALAVALVPPSVMSRQVLSWNCDAAARELRPALTASQRMAAWLHVVEEGGSTLGKCAASLDHPDPVAAVLHLAIDGVISLDCGACLTSSTIVSVPNLC